MRDRFVADQSGNLAKVTEGGSFLTYGHVVAYNKKARIKGQSVEPDAGYETQTAAEIPSEPASEENGSASDSTLVAHARAQAEQDVTGG